MKKDKSLDFKNEKERQEFINDVEDERMQEYRRASAKASKLNYYFSPTGNQGHIEYENKEDKFLDPGYEKLHLWAQGKPGGINDKEQD